MARTPKKKTDTPALGRTVALPAHLIEKYKDFPGIQAVSRRVLTGELPGSVDLRLKEDPSHTEDPIGTKRYWYLRWINTAIPGRWSNVTRGLGYVPVRIAELQDAEDVSDLYREAGDTDPMVRRGDKGKEVLVKIPMELYTAAKHAQIEARTRRSRSAKALKHDVATAAAGHFGGSEGSEAADMIHDDFTLDIRRSRVKLGDELQGSTELYDEA